MKSVLISIQPKWCELIASGKKTVEVRKTRPKLETPFKVYIYATKSGDRLVLKSDKVFEISRAITGKVIGEFVCDKVVSVVHYTRIIGDCVLFNTQAIENACLTTKKIEKYSSGKDVYGWHISDLVIYDKPRELSEFSNGSSRLEFSNTEDGFPWKWSGMTRPPQSWCYVESEVQGK